MDPIQEDQAIGEVIQEDELQLNDEHQEQPIPEEGLRNYQLSRDRERRAIRPPTRYFFADFVFCALVVGVEL